MLVEFSKISDESKVWIYSSEKKLNMNQIEYIENKISNHLVNWQSHKKDIEAAVQIVENRFLIIAVDETKVSASGCSIDSLYRLIQDIELQLSISLLNRLNVYCVINDKIVCLPISSLKDKVNASTLFYDLTINNKFQLSNFLKPIKNGWCNNLI
tara:strand:- start:1170 stop:1634 length:465 start_codon:yes stop_codon:yes gene_type:complete